jgi:surface antigen
MVGSFVRLAAAVVLGIALAGCASGPDYADRDDSGPSGGHHARPQSSTLQCVPYARQRSGVVIYGDAYTWWDKAAGKFVRAASPSEGAVMVLYNYAGPNRGHVAVVRELVDSRTIKIDHANWLDDGAIYVDNPVRDVSAGNDWSQVRVFNLRTGAWGSHIYPVQGFIGPGPDTGSGDLHVAQNRPQRDEISALIAGDNLADGDGSR